MTDKVAELGERLTAYRGAALRAVDYTTGFLQPDGGYIWEGYVPNAFHKQVYSWLLAGRIEESHRLMDWAGRNRLQTDGRLKEYVGDVYKQTWFALSAQRLGRYELSYPVMNYLMSLQAPCGGFPRYEDEDVVRAVASGFVGIAALAFGTLEVAKQAAQSCIDTLDRQPVEGRFYCHMARDGKVVTENDHPKALHVDMSKPKQIYYELGVPMLLMCRLYQVTREKKWLEAAKRFFETHLACFEDSFACVGSGKSALAAAIYYGLTDDERALEAAYRWCDFVVETQLPDGSWIDLPKEPDELLYYVDHAACFTIWLLETALTLESKAAQTTLTRPDDI